MSICNRPQRNVTLYSCAITKIIKSDVCPLTIRSTRRLPPPIDSDHVYETIRQLQLDMAVREQMRDRSNTGDSDYLRPATVSIHPAGGEAETTFNTRATVSTITVNADDARSSPNEQRLQRGGSEGSLAHTPSDDFVWM